MPFTIDMLVRPELKQFDIITIIKYCPFRGFLTKTYHPCSSFAIDRKLLACIVVVVPSILAIVVTIQAFINILHLFKLIHHINRSCQPNLN